MNTSTHVTSLLIALACIGFILALVRRNQLRIKFVVLWIPLGFAIFVLSAAPSLLDAAATVAGISYPPALLFLLAIAFLLLVCVHLSWEVSRTDERIRLLAEHVALMDPIHLQSQSDSRPADAASQDQ